MLWCCTPAMGHSKAPVMQDFTCDALQCKFLHVQYSAPDYEISQPIIIQISNGLKHYDGK